MFSSCFTFHFIHLSVSSTNLHFNPLFPPSFSCLPLCLHPLIYHGVSSASFTFQASDDELDGIQATCNDLLQLHEQLRAIVPNEQVKRRLEGEATFIAQEWSEVYNREKARLIRGLFEGLRSSLERNIEALDKEWAEVNEQFSGQGYSADLHERYQVVVERYWIQSLCTCVSS